MAKISATTVPMMFVLACIITMLVVSTARADLLPPEIPVIQIPGLLPPLPGAGKCWSSLSNIPSCLWEIYGSVSTGKVSKIGPACCKSIIQVPEDCWPKMLPFHPLVPPLLKSFCVDAAAPAPAGSSKLVVPTVNVTEEIKECWSSITSIKGCVEEVYKSHTSGQFTGIAPACCKAVTDVNDKCWPKMFPFNPFFPPLLKSTCAKAIGVAPSPE